MLEIYVLACVQTLNEVSSGHPELTFGDSELSHEAPVSKSSSKRWAIMHITKAWEHEMKPHEAPVSKSNSKQ